MLCFILASLTSSETLGPKGFRLQGKTAPISVIWEWLPTSGIYCGGTTWKMSLFTQ